VLVPASSIAPLRSPDLIQSRVSRNPSISIGQLSSSPSSMSYNSFNSERFNLNQSTTSRRRRSHSGVDSTSLSQSRLHGSLYQAQSNSARKLNDSMVYLDGPQIYTCAQCRTHLTSHDEIISKSFHGRHGKISFVRVTKS
jgi:hypothetical protein